MGKSPTQTPYSERHESRAAVVEMGGSRDSARVPPGGPQEDAVSSSHRFYGVRVEVQGWFTVN